MLEDTSRNYVGSTAVADEPADAQTLHGQGQRSHPGAAGRAKSSPGSRHKDILQKIQKFRVEFGPTRKDILNFTNQLAVMVRAGISLQDSLESIAEQNEKQKFRAIIIDLKNQIEAGQSFRRPLPNIRKYSAIFI